MDTKPITLSRSPYADQEDDQADQRMRGPERQSGLAREKGLRRALCYRGWAPATLFQEGRGGRVVRVQRLVGEVAEQG
jgi:hypothetical protein